MGGERIRQALAKAYKDGDDLDLTSWHEPDRTVGPKALSEIVRKAASHAHARTDPLIKGLTVKSSGDQQESFDLNSVTLTFNLRFDESHFACSIDFTDANFCRLNFDNCQFESAFEAPGVQAIEISFGRCAMKGLLNLSHSRVGRNVILQPKFETTGKIKLVAASIGGDLRMDGAQFRNVSGSAIDATRAVVNGAVSLEQVLTINSEILFPHATIGVHLILTGANLSNTIIDTSSGTTGPADTLTADKVTIGGSIFLDVGFTSMGGIRLLGADIGGQLLMSGANLVNPTGASLNATLATIDGGVFLNNGFSSKGEILFAGAKIGGQMAMHGATLSQPEGSALTSDGATIANDVFLSDGFQSTGEVRFTAATIGGGLSMTGAKLKNPTGNTLNANGARIGGAMLLRSGFESQGEIQLMQVAIGGSLSFSQARLMSQSSLEKDKSGSESSPENAESRSLNNSALTADHATIGGGVFLTDHFESSGEIRFERATVRGALSVSEAKLSSTSETTLNVIGATIDGGIFMEDFESTSGINLNRANSQGLSLSSNSPVQILANGASLGLLRDKPNSWSPDSDLSGATYLIDPTDSSWDDATDRTKWLQKMSTFSRTSWQQLEQVYRDRGERDKANEVAINMRVVERCFRRGWATWAKNLGSWIAEKFTGYGYRPGRSVLALLAVLLAVFIPLAFPMVRESMTASTAFGPTYAAGGPTAKELELATVKINDRCGDGTVRCFNALVYAVDLVIPLVDLGQVDTWHSDAHRGSKSPNWAGEQHFQVGAIMSWYLPVMSLLGWAFSTIGLLTVTRLGNRPS